MAKRQKAPLDGEIVNQLTLAANLAMLYSLARTLFGKSSKQSFINTYVICRVFQIALMVEVMNQKEDRKSITDETFNRIVSDFNKKL